MSTPNSPATQTNAPSDPSKYIFKRYDAGNNEINAEDPALPTFHITTTRGMGGTNKLTTLVLTTSGDKPSTVQGELDWKSKKITVGGVSKTFKEAKHKIGGTFSLDIEWTWPSGKYTTTHNSRVWTAKRGSQVLVTYTSLNVKAFSRNDPATLKFSAEISNEEKVFLVLALMFHDLQLPPVAEHRTFGEKAGDAGVAAGTTVAQTVVTNVASTAITSCCIVM